MFCLNPFSFIPDIEDEIFEWASRMYPTYAPTLTLVSKRVQLRVEFIIYETIALCSSRVQASQKNLLNVQRFEAVLLARPKTFFATRVRNLCITDTVPRKLTRAILSKCTGVRNLAIWQERGLGYNSSKLIHPFSSTLISLDTDRLTLDCLSRLGVEFPRLRSLAVLPWPGRTHIPNLEWLPALTKVHLDIENDDDWDDINDYPRDVKTILSTAPILHTLILDINVAGFGEMMEGLSGEDTRIKVMDKALRDNDNSVVDWEQFCGVHVAPYH
ncbi:hypothetical protein DXG01_009822 [Tephrocybe rancida]|nr:hypothetical protein DXG01_009822 [Tephrocybe rancida]